LNIRLFTINSLRLKLALKITMNEALFLRNPESSELGKKIIKHSIELIDKSGFESFTFKKLADEIHSTEAGIYRYFENKHKILLYLTAWYWSWLEFQISYQTNNMIDPNMQLEKVIELLTSPIEDDEKTDYVNERLLHQIIISEGSKSYLTKHVGLDNQQQFFKSYKDLCAAIGQIISACQPIYKYPKSLASTLIEMAHFQSFFMNNLPSLTDFSSTKRNSDISSFLKDLVNRCLQ
jgi:AcrR family transcriptional regulator